MSNDWVGVEHEVVVGVYINAINIFCSTTDNYLIKKLRKEIAGMVMEEQVWAHFQCGH